MKNIRLILYSIFLWALVSCEGDFIADANPSVFLIAPEDLCQEGIEKPNNRLDIEFSWTKSDQGNFINYRLEITDLETGDVTPKIIDGDSLITRVTLERGKNFSWQIFGILNENSEAIPSTEKMQFYSESSPESNFSPRPVIISTRQPTTSSIEITWEISERETLDNLEFEVFFGQEENPTEKLEDTKIEPERIIKEGLSNGEYYIKIVTTKRVGTDALYSTSSFKKITVTGN